MPIFLITLASLVAGFAHMPAWVAILAVVAVTAIGVMRGNAKAIEYGYSGDVGAAHAPSAIVFSLFVYSIVIGLPYLIGVGVRSVVG